MGFNSLSTFTVAPLVGAWIEIMSGQGTELV